MRRAPIEGHLHVGGRLAEHRVLIGRYALDTEVRRIRRHQIRDHHAAHHELLAEALHRLLGLEPEGVVGLHAQDEMHAAFEIEPELDLAFGWVKRPDRQADDHRDQN